MITDRFTTLRNSRYLPSDSKGNPLSVSGGKWPFGWVLLGMILFAAAVYGGLGWIAFRVGG